MLILHGGAGSGSGMPSLAFGGELSGPGQPLDKPSDGQRAKFPEYDCDNAALAQYRSSRSSGLRHLRLVLGNSMGGMHSWIWGTTSPGFMDALVRMASQPTEMVGRNWTVADRMTAPFTADANNFLYQWDSSDDYNPAPGLERVQATLLAMNSADDELNPPEPGIRDRWKRAGHRRQPAGCAQEGRLSAALSKLIGLPPPSWTDSHASKPVLGVPWGGKRGV